MFENIRIDKNYIDKLFDIDGYHYSNYPEFTVDDLILLLDLNPIFISEYSNWYLINGKLYYYKKHGLFNEIFLSEISHEFDLKNIKYNIVKNGDSIGLISESFRKKPYKFYDYDDYFKHKGYKVPRTLTNLDSTLSEILDPQNKTKLMEEIYKLTCFDIFSGQVDRGDTNFVFKEKSDTTLAPIFDNECSFIDTYEYNSSFDNLYMPKINKNKVDKDNLYFIYLLINNKTLLNYFTKALDIDISKVLKRTINKYHLIIPNNDINFINNFFDNRKIKMEHTLKLLNEYK